MTKGNRTPRKNRKSLDKIRPVSMAEQLKNRVSTPTLTAAALGEKKTLAEATEEAYPVTVADDLDVKELLKLGKEAQIQNLYKNIPTVMDMSFKPTREMSLVRADWWADHKAGVFQENGVPLSTTLALKQLWMDPNSYFEDLGKWQQIKGFRKWFERSPVSEFSREAALLVQVSLEALYDIVTSPDPKSATARVQAARTAFEIAGVSQKKKHEVHILDKTVAQMTTEEKRQLIARAAALDGEVDYDEED